jgi:hypothetical protein
MKLACEATAVSEQPERTAQGCRRFHCRERGKQFNEWSGSILNRGGVTPAAVTVIGANSDGTRQRRRNMPCACTMSQITLCETERSLSPPGVPRFSRHLTVSDRERDLITRRRRRHIANVADPVMPSREAALPLGVSWVSLRQAVGGTKTFSADVSVPVVT